MARKIPGIGKQIRELVDRHRGERSVRKFVIERFGTEISQQQVSEWMSDVVPSFDNLLRLEKEFRVPWQWIVVGDDGYKAIKTYKETRRPQ